ncbi:hypothetical protein K440DRAFT_613946 [Wilcoxina mikolae CBS 423.85]|nr:hypothetical protein K440DRAFT_613946 [Wilcoxina mikolae CBS 423.85]
MQQSRRPAPSTSNNGTESLGGESWSTARRRFHPWCQSRNGRRRLVTEETWRTKLSASRPPSFTEDRWGGLRYGRVCWLLAVSLGNSTDIPNGAHASSFRISPKQSIPNKTGFLHTIKR